jgi:hypothetical protein
MKKQIVTIVLGAAVMMGTVTSLFAQYDYAPGYWGRYGFWGR